MNPSDLQALITQIQDETGLDQPTAERIALARLAPPGPATSPITKRTLARALTAPPTMNEPAVLPPPAPSCPDCNGMGFYKEAVPYGHPNFGKLFPCRCKLAAKESHLKSRRVAILSKLQEDMGPELCLCRLEPIGGLGAFDLTRACDEESRESLTFALRAARSFLADPRQWLYFYGPVGVGKSHLAAAIGTAWADGGLGRAAYASAPSLLRYIRAGYKDGSADERLIALQLVDLLILDDLGTEYHKPGEQYGHTDSTLFELLADRATYARPTVITSNLAVDDLEPRIASRIRGRARAIYMYNTDQRGRS